MKAIKSSAPPEARNTLPSRIRVLGIDPGTVVMGYGVVEGEGDQVELVKYGTLETPKQSPIGERLSYLYSELLEIIRHYRPDAIAIEQPFVSKNIQSAMAIGRAQAVAILAAAGKGIPAHEYAPTQIKQRVASYGASSKAQVQEMVRLQLGLEKVPEPDDAADALAVAICHLHEMHLNKLLTSQPEEK